MNVLLVHEYYRSSAPSGEDKVFRNEKTLLKNNGVNIVSLIIRNDIIGSSNGPSVLKTALNTPWSIYGRRLLKKKLKEYTPDIVHFHNTFPLLSPAVIRLAKDKGIPTVQTFHNFRSICPQAMLLRDGTVCERCLVSLPFYSLLYRCYRKSFFATLPLFLCSTIHRIVNTWRDKVDAFIVLSQFNKQIFVRAGFPKEKIYVKPNFFYDLPNAYSKEKRDYWVFIGRLKEEKGVQFIPKVWHKLGDDAPSLHVLGDGPLRKNMEKEVVELGLRHKITIHGNCSESFIINMLRSASGLFFPSIWYEGFPLVIGEAFRAGVAVATSNIGTQRDLVENGVTGVHFEPGNINDMANKIRTLVRDKERLAQMGRAAREEYKKKYTPEENFNILMSIYHKVKERS